MNKENVKWHQLTAEAVAQQLHTNASCGLSCKEARSRYRKRGANTLFDQKKKKSLDFWKATFKDPALILLLFSCVLALCFSELSIGISALVCFLCGAIYAIRLFVLQKKHLVALDAYRIPTVTVLRDAKKYTAGARNVVPGDILLLKAGDIVPCDCRLISDRDLQVLTLSVDMDGNPEYSFVPRSASSVYPPHSQVFSPFAENMLYGGSEIVCGEAVAIAVETAQHTFLGAMESFEIPAERIERKPVGFHHIIKPYLYFYSSALFILLIPFTLIGMLTAPEEIGIMYVFLSVCALVGAASQSFILFHFRSAVLHAEISCFSTEHLENRAVLKSESSIQRLSGLTDLFVLGHSAFSDGRLHLKSVWLGSGEIDLQQESAPALLSSLAEASSLYQLACNRAAILADNLPRDTYRNELIQLCRFDIEAMKMRVQNTSLKQIDGTENYTLEAQTKEGNLRLLFTDHPEQIERCLYFEENGMRQFLSPDHARVLMNTLKEVKSLGLDVQIVIRQLKQGTYSFVGALGIGEDTLPSLTSVTEAFEKSGIRITFFLKGTPEEEAYYASTLKKTIFYKSKQVDADSQIIEKLYEKYRVLQGFSRTEIIQLMRILQQNKHRVAVLGSSVEDISILRMASLSIACDSLPYHKHGIPDNLLDYLGEDGKENSERTSQAIRRASDLLIPRATKQGGGLDTLLRALTACRTAGVHISVILRFLFVSTLFRLTVTLLSLCLGCGLMSGAELLYAGFWVEIIGVILILKQPISPRFLQKPIVLNTKTVIRTFTDRKNWLPAISASAFCLIYAWILSLCKITAFSECTPFLFFSTLLLQLAALYVSIRPFLNGVFIKSMWLSLILILIPAALFTVLSLLFDPFDQALGLGQWSPVLLLSLPIAPGIFLILQRVFSKK